MSYLSNDQKRAGRARSRAEWAKVSREQRQQWGLDKPPAAVPAPMKTGIAQTQEETMAAGMGVRTPWVKACEFCLPFGKKVIGGHCVKGRALHAIAQDVEGLLYLDWLLGKLEESGKKLKEKSYVHTMLETYLTEPRVKAEVAKALATRRGASA